MTPENASWYNARMAETGADLPKHPRIEKLKEHVPGTEAHHEKKVKEVNPQAEFLPHVTAEKHSYQATVAKKLEKTPAPPLWKSKVEFLPATASFLSNCGIKPEYVNPAPIGQGFTHIVFDYVDGMVPKVVKIPRAVSPQFMSSGYGEDKENIEIVKKFFGEYAVPTEIRMDQTTGRYLYVQEKIKGRAVTSLDEPQSIRTQIADLARLNREMMRQKNITLDFIGVPGFLSYLRHRFWSIISRKSHFDLSNIWADENGKLKIIDVGVERFGKRMPLKQKFISWVGTLVNRLAMRLYFGVDILP